MTGNTNPDGEERGKPPRRDWYASERFVDLRLSHWVEILLTLALVGVGVAQVLVYLRQAKIMDKQADISANQLTATQVESRAWVGPLGVKIFSIDTSKPLPLEKGKGIPVQVGYTNVGKEPAIDFGFVHTTTLVPIEDWNKGAETPEINAWKSSCLRRLTTTSESFAIFPSSNGRPYTVSFDSAADDAVPKTFATDDFISGKQVFLMLGCMIYRSAGEIRHTSVCSYYANVGVPHSDFGVCGIGNDAN